ncbi:TlpA family protein disulfide reductase [Sediminicola sp. 1XM1-17]|uniref:TlpA family protein disulfide reductase n=1 Tax=Sediminicola sp. 1XM1-17 TaxID=3127702 RepID=UPI003076CE2C
MFRSLLFFFLILSTNLGAQHTISGPFSPSEDFKWVMAYQLKPSSQEYVTAGPVKNGDLELVMPKTAEAGLYRMVYAIPTDEFYFDVIYNGKEDIQLTFNVSNGVSFTASEENGTYLSYLDQIKIAAKKLDEYYTSGQKNKTVLNTVVKDLEETQNSFETKSEGMIAQHFIKANRPYIPKEQETQERYIQSKKEHFFDHLDFHNPILQSSGFLTDKAMAFVFTPLAQSATNFETDHDMEANLATLNTELTDVDPLFKAKLFEKLWKETTKKGMGPSSDLIFNNYLLPLSKSSGLKEIQEITDKIELDHRLRIGAKAPEILWTEKGEDKKLSDLSGAQNYVLLFWSSTCSHCLKEVPELYTALKDNNTVQVLAVGLEDNDATWKEESSKLIGFHHVLGLGKWDNEYVTLYDVHQTPTYFVLDAQKRISAKPAGLEELLTFLNK